MVEALRLGFQSELMAPVRHHHAIARTGEPDATMLLMPAWSGPQGEPMAGLKLVTVVPGNANRNLPTINGIYVLNDGISGMPLAILDGAALTVLRTAAASALAADYLARPDSAALTMLGAGAMAPHLIAAHAAVRPIKHVTIWNRNIEKAHALAAEIRSDMALDIIVEDDLPRAVSSADIVSAATLSSQPLVRSADVRPGTHVDLVGAFSPQMRESDGPLMGRATVFADTLAGAEAEAGDILQAIDEGFLTMDAVVADLFDLTSARHVGRMSDGEITVFKSVGASIEDLAAAAAIHNWMSASP